jgi:hypothetical protein
MALRAIERPARRTARSTSRFDPQQGMVPAVDANPAAAVNALATRVHGQRQRAPPLRGLRRGHKTRRAAATR